MQIGSIELGKKADIVILDFNRPHLTPYRTVALIPQIIGNCHSSDVDTTIVNGEILMQNQAVQTVDEQKVLRETREAALNYWNRLGVKGV
jgi:5-methylthioadenosine/S-adenosylhomocysteine deaminase